MSLPGGPQDPYSTPQQPAGGVPVPPPPPPVPYGVPAAPAPGYGQPPAYGQQPGYPVAPPPAYGYGTPQGTPPPNYLVWSIITILLCTIPGIVAIVFSTQVNSKWGMGDAAGAYDASKKAKTWALVGTILGVVVIVAYIGLVAAGVIASTSTHNFNN